MKGIFVANMIKIKDKEFVPFIDKESLNSRIVELGRQISMDFIYEEPVILGVMNGSFMFLSDLARQLDVQAEITFVKIASYSGTKSSGKVQELIGLGTILTGRNVIVVEDIVDTGLSMYHLLKSIRLQRPKRISLVTLLLKPDALKFDLEIDYVGFEIPNKFVVGYGLDYEGFGRNLPEIYQLKY